MQQHDHPIVERYRRTDMSRIGEWESLDSRWKTPASAGLISHDVYHHRPGDRGTFAEEIATFGAEWYVDLQPTDMQISTIGKQRLKSFETNVIDTVLNALDSREKNPFALPKKSSAQLTSQEMDYFCNLANMALKVVDDSADPRASSRPEFETRFLENILWGYSEAKARFPNQNLVRIGSQTLRDTVASLDESEVPFGHEITLTLDGYDCAVTYDDADAAFSQATDITSALMMVWCSCATGYPVKEITIHKDESSFIEFVGDHFMRQDENLADEARIIPHNDSSGLTKIYVRSPEYKILLQDRQGVRVPLDIYRAAEYSPRQVPIF